jgi:hypothetical protein
MLDAVNAEANAHLIQLIVERACSLYGHAVVPPDGQGL